MTFAGKIRSKGLTFGYITQKTSEAIFSSIILSISGIIIQKFSYDPQYYGIYNNPSSLDSVLESFAVTIFFNIFTLYPIMMFVPLLISRSFFKLNRIQTTIISAISSLLYVIGWSYCIDFFVDWTMWIVFILTTLFVFWSSFQFYPGPETDDPTHLY